MGGCWNGCWNGINGCICPIITSIAVCILEHMAIPNLMRHGVGIAIK